MHTDDTVKLINATVRYVSILETAINSDFERAFERDGFSNSFDRNVDGADDTGES